MYRTGSSVHTNFFPGRHYSATSLTFVDAFMLEHKDLTAIFTQGDFSNIQKKMRKMAIRLLICRMMVLASTKRDFVLSMESARREGFGPRKASVNGEESQAQLCETVNRLEEQQSKMARQLEAILQHMAKLTQSQKSNDYEFGQFESDVSLME